MTVGGSTLHGVKVPEEIQLRQAIGAAIEASFKPVAKAWDQRAQDMLDVLADSSLARAEVRRGVQTIRLAAMLGVLAMVATGLAVWATLERDRSDRRRFRQFDEQARTAAAADQARRLRALCPAVDEWPVATPERSKGRPAPGKP